MATEQATQNSLHPVLSPDHANYLQSRCHRNSAIQIRRDPFLLHRMERRGPARAPRQVALQLPVDPQPLRHTLPARRLAGLENRPDPHDASDRLHECPRPGIHTETREFSVQQPQNLPESLLQHSQIHSDRPQDTARSEGRRIKGRGLT